MWRVGHGQPAAVQAIAVGSKNPSPNVAPAELTTDAPASVPKKQKVATAGASFGFMKPLVLAAMLGAGLVSAGTPACAQNAQGAPIDSRTVIEEPVSNRPYTLRLPESLALQPNLNLEPWQRVQEPKDTAARPQTRGEIVLDQLARDVELLMRVTPRDMANPSSVVFLANAPGYKEPPKDQVLRLVERAVRQIPLGELPGGPALARLVTALPNAGALDAENMSFDELSSALGDVQGRWLESKLRPLIDGYELEAGVAAFAAVTAARAASPDVAAMMDRITPAVTVWRTQSDDNNSNARVRLRYRNQEILPNVDIRAETSRTYGPFVLHGELEGTLSLENHRHVTGTATAGASWSADGRFVNARATYFDSGETRASVVAGYSDSTSRSIAYTTLTGIVGGREPNRLSWEVDYDREVRIGRANGSFGVYTGVTWTADGRDPDVRAGLVFRLRF